MRYTELDKLTMKLDKALCPTACCHMESRALAAFRSGFANSHPVHVEVLGLRGVHIEPQQAVTQMKRLTTARASLAGGDLPFFKQILDSDDWF